MTNEQNIQDLIDGKESAFRQLVEEYKDKVVNTCYGFTSNLHDAEDIAQDVFIEVFESIHKFNQESTLSTWIYRISVNKSLDFLRRAKRKKRWAMLTRIDNNNSDEHDNNFTHSSTPDLPLEQKERIDILNRAIGSLPENQRIAFTLHKYEDLSYKEIAEILNTSLSSVESLMHRAKNNLKKRLEKYYESQKD